MNNIWRILTISVSILLALCSIYTAITIIFPIKYILERDCIRTDQFRIGKKFYWVDFDRIESFGWINALVFRDNGAQKEKRYILPSPLDFDYRILLAEIKTRIKEQKLG